MKNYFNANFEDALKPLENAMERLKNSPNKDLYAMANVFYGRTNRSPKISTDRLREIIVTNLARARSVPDPHRPTEASCRRQTSVKAAQASGCSYVDFPGGEKGLLKSVCS